MGERFTSPPSNNGLSLLSVPAGRLGKRCAIAVLITFAYAVLAGCTRAAPSSSAEGRHPWTIPHVLRIAEISEPDNLNPYFSELDVTSDLAFLVYSYLVITDNRGRLIGDLASSVPSLANGGISRDGRTYVYHLRRNIIWQDGAPFAVRDIVASWHAVMNPHNNTFDRQGYDRVASIEAAGPRTVVVRLRQRYPPFVSQFFAGGAGKPVLPAHIFARSDFNSGELSTHPIGTGPFCFVSWTRGDRIILERFDRYFKGRPNLSRVEMRFIPDMQTIAVELQEHHVDLIETAQASLIDEYRSIGGVVIELAPANRVSSIQINASKRGLHDVTVRRALAMAVPYQAILHDIEHNLPSEARNVLPVAAIGYELLPRRTYEPAAARSLLERAGWRRDADGVRTRKGVRLAFTLVTVAGNTSGERIGLLLQSSFRAVGVELAMKTYPARTIWTANGPILGDSFDLALYANNLDWDPDLYNLLACDRWYPKGENIDRFCDPRLDALERAGLQTDDPSRRAAIYRTAGRLIWSEVPYIPLFGGRIIVVRSSDLRNYSVSPIGWWNAWQWDI